MPLTRRALLAACASAAVPALADPPAAVSDDHKSLGLVIHSFPIRTQGDRDRKPADRFADPIRFLGYAGSLGARGVQVGLGVRDEPGARAIREAAEARSMYLEGIVALPRDASGLDRFEAEIRTAERAGAEVVRTVMLSGRRYETFATLDAFRRFAEATTHALALAAPVVARHGILLAVENHKDWRAHELLDVLDRIGNDHVGVCLDTGNSIALLEDPMDVIEALAPRAFTTHFKDMAVEPYPDGFRLAEVLFGDGILDLPRVVRTVRSARPRIRFNIEMITRDPLDVPCLDDRYWATFPELPARHLARALRLVRDHPPRGPLPRIKSLSRAAQLEAEDANVRRCLAFARDRLGL
jgi:sugar phosphate isomerase/epimerase